MPTRHEFSSEKKVVKIVFKDGTQSVPYEYDDLYVKTECLCVRNGDDVTKFPLMNIHCYTHPY